MMSELSKEAILVVQNYLALPFPWTKVSCPYYNNRRAKMRGALRAQIGKGSPRDIADEAVIISLREKMVLQSMDAERLKRFLVDHRLGVDCSAFAFYVLDAEVRAKRGKHLAACLSYGSRNPIRQLLIRMRPVENANVEIFAKAENSAEIDLRSAGPGDLIVMRKTGEKHDRDHILLIVETEKADGALSRIRYAHSFAWRSDGQYGHGVREGIIKITHPEEEMLEQEWEEKGQIGMNNETWLHGKLAETLSIRRLRALQEPT